ncbi:hypothetical protein B0J15DRAFT_236099 [Fusarium solani]|uniref:Uncharacterized protein n=1 Tax=Fusarium solani TaxID=169388 RepID=A0A9P9KNS0_FUSSL|nr:uncharacterized protein B0J15DRAFT_236099 [Fusarium solani]KAH7265950.1 hypothetical protein B0J15DRAFT_236099 [Fusarium solani]
MSSRSLWAAMHAWTVLPAEVPLSKAVIVEISIPEKGIIRKPSPRVPSFLVFLLASMEGLGCEAQDSNTHFIDDRLREQVEDNSLSHVRERTGLMMESYHQSTQIQRLQTLVQHFKHHSSSTMSLKSTKSSDQSTQAYFPARP